MGFKRPNHCKEKVIKEIKIFKCSFCKNNSIGKCDKWYYCADNKCAIELRNEREK